MLEAERCLFQSTLPMHTMGSRSPVTCTHGVSGSSPTRKWLCLASYSRLALSAMRLGASLNSLRLSGIKSSFEYKYHRHGWIEAVLHSGIEVARYRNLPEEFKPGKECALK